MRISIYLVRDKRVGPTVSRPAPWTARCRGSFRPRHRRRPRRKNYLDIYYMMYGGISTLSTHIYPSASPRRRCYPSRSRPWRGSRRPGRATSPRRPAPGPPARSAHTVDTTQSTTDIYTVDTTQYIYFRCLLGRYNTLYLLQISTR